MQHWIKFINNNLELLNYLLEQLKLDVNEEYGITKLDVENFYKQKDKFPTATKLVVFDNLNTIFRTIIALFEDVGLGKKQGNHSDDYAIHATNKAYSITKFQEIIKELKKIESNNQLDKKLKITKIRGLWFSLIFSLLALAVSIFSNWDKITAFFNQLTNY